MTANDVRTKEGDPANNATDVDLRQRKIDHRQLSCFYPDIHASWCLASQRPL